MRIQLGFIISLCVANVKVHTTHPGLLRVRQCPTKLVLVVMIIMRLYMPVLLQKIIDERAAVYSEV